MTSKSSKTEIHVFTECGESILFFPYDQILKDFVKHELNGKWVPSLKSWRIDERQLERFMHQAEHRFGDLVIDPSRPKEVAQPAKFGKTTPAFPSVAQSAPSLASFTDDQLIAECKKRGIELHDDEPAYDEKALNVSTTTMMGEWG